MAVKKTTKTSSGAQQYVRGGTPKEKSATLNNAIKTSNSSLTTKGYSGSTYGFQARRYAEASLMAAKAAVKAENYRKKGYLEEAKLADKEEKDLLKIAKEFKKTPSSFSKGGMAKKKK